MIVEGSKDGGLTWQRFLDGYNARTQPPWLNAFNNSITPTPSLYRTRLLNLTANGNFSANETVLIRFRLYADASVNGWGWTIDNLFIQDPITAIESQMAGEAEVYPNPFTSELHIRAEHAGSVQVELVNVSGQCVWSGTSDHASAETLTIKTGHLPSGMYIVKIRTQKGFVSRKLIKTD